MCQTDMSIVDGLGMTHNGLRIGDGGAFEKCQPNICTNAQ